jgi:succinate dehydrogenase flavin-adding protein (antitoxin of CptAB toxin-antitoxin module)
MPDRATEGRLRWRMMRRGLLELDLVFERFLERDFANLDDGQRADLERLLDYEDTDLWAMVSGRKQCADASLGFLVQRLRAAR